MCVYYTLGVYYKGNYNYIFYIKKIYICFFTKIGRRFLGKKDRGEKTKVNRTRPQVGLMKYKILLSFLEIGLLVRLYYLGRANLRLKQGLFQVLT